MIKSFKGKFILSIFVALGFIYTVFRYINFSGEGEFLPRLLLYIAMIASVYNAGMMTQQFLQSRGK